MIDWNIVCALSLVGAGGNIALIYEAKATTYGWPIGELFLKNSILNQMGGLIILIPCILAFFSIHGGLFSLLLLDPLLLEIF